MSGTRSPQELDRELRDVLGPVVERAGLFLEDVNVSGPARRRLVRVTVDLADGPGGVTSDALGQVSRAVSLALDEVDDVLEGAYLLEVSTPGTDRPLTTPRHFRRAQGRLVTLETSRGPVVGRVRAVDDAEVHLVDETAKDGPRRVSVSLGTISRGRVEIELNRVADSGDER